MTVVRLKTPCETIIWKSLPCIRRELAMLLVKEHGLSQKEAASRLGVTEAAVSQYLSGKRGRSMDCDEDGRQEVVRAAGRLASQDREPATVELCRICRFIRAEEPI